MVMQFHPDIEYLYKFLESSQCICEVFQSHFFMVHVFCFTDFIFFYVLMFMHMIYICISIKSYIYKEYHTCITCVTVTHF